ncbi:MAG: menaquinone biosynthesis decarboxylase [Methanomassiliicoccales archaeon]|jgi:4-hydroxy-3-polyprenylbenzoate decarboxylase
MIHYRNLGEFISRLETEGELLRVKGEVSPHLEITEITDRMSKSPKGGKALLFERVTGSAFPVLTNAFGSERRMAMALSCDRLDELEKKIEGLLDTKMPGGFLGKLGMLPELVSLSKSFPRTRRMSRPPCQEVVITGDDIDLDKIPVLHCWPKDGGRFVTLPVVFTKSIDGHARNVGMYRMQIFDKKTTGMHWHIHKDGSHNFNAYKKQGKRMPVAVAIGTDPAITYAATAPMPQGMDEMILAGFIRGSPVDMVKCKTIDMEVPAESEFILEGYVDPEEKRIEGPFGDHTGYYSLQGEYPVFHVTAITHRKNAVYSTTVVGRPPMEDCYMAKATERIFLPPLKKLLPEIVDYWMPWEGVFHNIVVVAIHKEYPMQARKVMNALWGNNQMSFAKMILVIDNPGLLGNPSLLLEKVQENLDLAHDLVLTEGILDVLDHSAPNPLFGGKLGIDATERVEGEPARTIHDDNELNEEDILGAIRGLKVNVSSRSIGLHTRNPVVLVGVKKEGVSSKHVREKFRPMASLLGCTLVLFDDIDLKDDSLVLWKTFNNIDPLRDMELAGTGVIIDATKKGLIDGHVREWPDEIEMSKDVKDRIEHRKKEFGLG